MAIILSQHLAAELGEKKLTVAYVEAAVLAPDWTRPGRWTGSTEAFKAIPEFGNRIVRVAHRTRGTDIFVITAYWDRGARRP
jgi:hypothetical protein